MRDFDPPSDDNNPDDPVDRFFIDRDDIILGADFPTAMSYNGAFELGTIFLSFRVNCAEGFTGDDCTGKPPALKVTLVCTNKFSGIHESLWVCRF